jgi:hypothetical protein
MKYTIQLGGKQQIITISDQQTILIAQGRGNPVNIPNAQTSYYDDPVIIGPATLLKFPQKLITAKTGDNTLCELILHIDASKEHPELKGATHCSNDASWFQGGTQLQQFLEESDYVLLDFGVPIWGKGLSLTISPYVANTIQPIDPKEWYNNLPKTKVKSFQDLPELETIVHVIFPSSWSHKTVNGLEIITEDKKYFIESITLSKPDCEKIQGYITDAIEYNQGKKQYSDVQRVNVLDKQMTDRLNKYRIRFKFNET